MGSESAAVDALERLGLTSYEARVFVALQKLGSGTAREIAQVSEVPRSQVYTTAESLEERGLIEEQRATPIEFRTVGPGEAREKLAERRRDDERRAFEYLAAVEHSLQDQSDASADIWTLRGRDSVTRRVTHLLDEADDRVVFGTASVELFPTAVRDALAGVATDGVRVVVVSRDPDVLALAESLPNVDCWPLDGSYVDDVEGGRLLAVDGETILLSVLGAGIEQFDEEHALWSSGTQFATVLLQLLDGWFDRELAVA
ncbi:TrmB family transcriptional regulator [Haloarchaeobius iranensis]|uniref:Sugar-specific transcriptional regulator TrmB n=1 Tax=Haloarchaeobius iranensis TaxID=996166 RepID=A0A1H0A723_9EURY|nr:helix-turn-helix domain-containing protein [Haloarchaeobius iranensis]SDN29428.1 Sugar-specific transcriptional regulator TrmB [Haloarchaeobius iranensis]